MTPSGATTGRRPRLPRGEGRQLRDEILAATEKLLLETGSVQAVSIRAVADRVGVTPPSIYRHFADKAALIFDVCVRHFTAIEDFLRARSDTVDDPIDRLAALGRAYMEFGLANPEPYRIMFMTRPDVVPTAYHGDVLAESAAFGLLRDCVQAAIDAGRLRPELDDAFRVSLGLWARVHGLTSLYLSRPDLAWPEDGTFFDEYAASCLVGIVATGDGEQATG
jgi:AcrR family transcriptional regulator